MPFPSREQSHVINHRGCPLVVVAGPGTGKTQTLVERMIVLLREDISREVSFVTFTRTSMRDTERKLANEFGESALSEARVEFPRVSTLHTYAKSLVHRYGRSISINPAFSILIEEKGERALILDEIILDLGLAISSDELSEAISQYRATREWPLDFPTSSSEQVEIVERLDILLCLYRALDMQGVVQKACEILELPDALLPQLYLQVDEYQDLNQVDQEFISHLSSHPASEIVLVGDDAQSIYGFRFANFEGLQSLWDLDDWENQQFPDSFRLEPHILNAALDLLGDTNYLGARINRKPPSQKKISVLQCTSPEIQIEAIARDIQFRLQLSLDNPEDNLTYCDFLILCPTGSQVDQVTSRLNSEFNLPAHSPSKPSINDDLWCLLLVIRMASNSDPLALRQWLPIVGYSEEEISNLRLGAIDQYRGFFEFISSTEEERLSEFLRNLENIRSVPISVNDFLERMSEIVPIEIPVDFCALTRSLEDEEGSLPTLSNLILQIYQHIGILEGEEVVADDDRILVATMHSAKGLEAPYVYCAWMNSTFMPLSGRDPDEQKRILYVALTRAKRDIVVTFPERFDSERNRRMGRKELSPFINEIENHIEIFRVTAPNLRSGQLPWIQ